MPAVLWIMAAALTILILLIVFGYYAHWRHRAKAMVRDCGDVACLSAEKQRLVADNEELQKSIDNHKNELLQREAEREEQERLREELVHLEKQCLAKDQENESLRQEVGEKENHRHFLAQTISDLQSQKRFLEQEIDQLKKDAESLPDNIEELKEQVESYNKILADMTKVELRLQELHLTKETLEQKIQKMKFEEEKIQNKLNPIKEEYELLHRDVSNLRNNYGELTAIVSTLQSEQNYLGGDVARIQDEIKVKKNDLESINKYINDLKAQKVNLEKEVFDLGVKRKEKNEIKEQVHYLTARKATLEEEIKKLEARSGGLDPEDELAQYEDLLKEPECLQKDQFAQAYPDQDEYAFLDTFKSKLSKMDIYYHPRVVDAFHTSLKCQTINPLTVLAGVSGTGKTLLPIVYANMIGMHHLVLSVQPRWDSPQDLFGFYNYLEKQYKATDLSRSMIRLDPFNYNEPQYASLNSSWAKDRMFMVLLDEMNLARTEYYFSDFLSKLELRSQVDSPEDKRKRHNAEIELDVGPGQHRFRLWVPDNILFIGTMNEDETTQSLSDKVLDRANVLRFGKPDEDIRLAGDQRDNIEQNNIAGKEFLPFKKWQEWRKNFNEHDLWFDEVDQWTRTLNSALDKVGRPFGFRVMKAIPTYVANYPRVNEEERHKLAFADQVEQKIIPKVRGLEIDDPRTNECLEEIQGTLENFRDQDPYIYDAFKNARDESSRAGLFTWHGVKRSMDNQ